MKQDETDIQIEEELSEVMTEKFIKCVSETIKEMVLERVNELSKIYNNDEEKIKTALIEEFKNIAEIKVDEI
jgi:transposase-like protein